MSTLYGYTNARRLTGMIASLITLMSFVNAVHGQEFDQVSAHIDAQTSALVRIDSAALDALIDTTKQDGKDSEQTVLQVRLKQTRELLGNDPIWLAIGFPIKPWAVRILVRDPDQKRIEQLNGLWDIPKHLTLIQELKESDQLVSNNSARLDQWKKLLAPPEDLKSQRGMIRFGCLPPANLYDTYTELLTDLPDYLGGGPVTVLTDGLQSVSGTFDLKTGRLEGTIGSASSAAAIAFADQATKLITALPTVDKDRSLLKPIRDLLQSSTLKPVEKQVRWQIEAKENWQPKKVLELAVGSQSGLSATKR